MIESFAYEKLISRELKNANRDKKVFIVVELSNQKEDFKVIIALKSLENTQCLQTLGKKFKNSEFLQFLLAGTLGESIFAGINFPLIKISLLTKLDPRKLIQMIKTFL